LKPGRATHQPIKNKKKVKVDSALPENWKPASKLETG
jgi:hypothetical protein